jgi:hypothetical protein
MERINRNRRSDSASRIIFRGASSGQTIKKNMKSRKYLFWLGGWVAVWLPDQQGILMHERHERQARRTGAGCDRIASMTFAAPCRLNGGIAA